MSLIDDFKTPCTMLERKRQADGAGGFYEVWEDGVVFEAAVTFNSSMEAKKEEKNFKKIEKTPFLLPFFIV